MTYSWERKLDRLEQTFEQWTHDHFWTVWISANVFGAALGSLLVWLSL